MPVKMVKKMEWPYSSYADFLNERLCGVYLARVWCGETGSGPIIHTDIVLIPNGVPRRSTKYLTLFANGHELKDIQNLHRIGEYEYGKDGNTPRIILYAGAPPELIKQFVAIAELYSAARKKANRGDDFELIIEETFTETNE